MNRRGFLQGAAAGAASLALGLWKLQPRDASARTVSQAATLPEYTGWADVYRSQWTWDKVGRSTHFVNCWPQAHCTWNVYRTYPTSTRVAARKAAATASGCTTPRASSTR
jgi:hypothetical protein